MLILRLPSSQKLISSLATQSWRWAQVYTVEETYQSLTQSTLTILAGTGVLTKHILEQASRIIAVELDPRMSAELTKRVQGTPSQSRLQIILGDFVKLESVPSSDVCISNTPYQVCCTIPS